MATRHGQNRSAARERLAVGRLVPRHVTGDSLGADLNDVAALLGEATAIAEEDEARYRRGPGSAGQTAMTSEFSTIVTTGDVEADMRRESSRLS